MLVEFLLIRRRESRMRTTTRLVTASLACCLLPALLHADCPKDQDHRSSTEAGILVTDFTISGIQTLSSSELAKITGKLTGLCFDEDSEELKVRVRNLFQDRGFFAAVVKGLSIKTNDPLARPKPVTLEAEVGEGLRYKLAGIKVVGNNAVTTVTIRSEFTLRKGDPFERNKIASGLDGLRNLYGADGFLDSVFIPDTQSLSDATVFLTLTVEEGPQYRMGKLEILGDKEISEKLEAEWQLSEGAVYDATYLEKYLDTNRSLLPRGFTRQNVQVVRNCPEALVRVRLPLEATGSLSRPENVECEKPHDSSKAPQCP